MAAWRSAHGSWWATHFCWDWFLSFGVHVDAKRRYTARERIPYGPYVDFHLGPAVLSLGVNPIYSTDRDADSYRAGTRAGGV
jgi:hypothetical protein